MAYIISKPIVCIIGSRSIKELNLNLFIDPTHVAQIISGGAIGVDTIAERWAKVNNIEFIAELPNYRVWGTKAPLERDKDMVKESDVIIAFWDGRSHGTKYTIDYALSLGRKVIIHLIENLD